MLDEVLLHVVAVDLCATEDYGLVHFVLFNGPHCVLALQELDGFGPHFYNPQMYFLMLFIEVMCGLLEACTWSVGSWPGVVFDVDFICLSRENKTKKIN